MKYTIIRNENDYVINADENGNGGYNVVPKSVDPYNKYDIEDVRAYVLEHPEDVLDFEALQQELLVEQVKSTRDKLIKDTIWRVQRYESEIRLGITTTDNITNIDVYIQALRDIPQQEGFPTDIIWPTLP